MPGRNKNTGGGRGRAPPPASREFRWIDWIRSRQQPHHAVRIAAGDDAAAWKPRPGHDVVLTVDTQVDGVHFRRSWMRWHEIGRRAATASLSDLAAMGARPACLLAAIVLEKGTSTRSFREIFRGIEETGQECGADVVGGNLSSGPLSISITAVGQCRPERLLRRSTARPGDEIWVTGTPGLSRYGREHLERPRRRRPTRAPDVRAVRASLQAYKRPRARVGEAQFLAERWPVRAMVDVSDGLLADLSHIILESAKETGRRLGAELDEGACRSLEHLEPLLSLRDESLAESLTAASDDYELCFTTAPLVNAGRRAQAFARRFQLPVTRIGRVAARRGIRLRKNDGTTKELREKGWKHL